MERNNAKRKGLVAWLNSDKLVRPSCFMVYSRASHVASTYQQRVASVQRLHGVHMRDVFKRDTVGALDAIANVKLAAVVCRTIRGNAGNDNGRISRLKEEEKGLGDGDPRLTLEHAGAALAYVEGAVHAAADGHAKPCLGAMQ